MSSKSCHENGNAKRQKLYNATVTVVLGKKKKTLQ